MPRSIWNGAISFGLVTIPVSLVAAEESTAEVELHMIDKKTMSRVRQKRVAETTGEEVPWADIVKGYEYERGKYVVLEPEEIEAASPRATHTIDVVGVVCGDCIRRPFYEKPYYVVPEPSGRKAYALLREVLRRNHQVAVARVVIRTRQYVAALFPEGDALVLDLLRYADELRAPSDLDLPPSDLEGVGVTEKEIALAEQLVAAMVDEWDPSEYSDEFRNDLLALVRQKATQGGIVAPSPAVPTTLSGEAVDIMQLLKASIEAAEKARDGNGAGRSAEPSGAVPDGRRRRRE